MTATRVRATTAPDIRPEQVRLRRASTDELTGPEISNVRALLVAAFEPEGEDEAFTAVDWDHAVGGTHFLLELDGEIVCHASVVERDLHVGGRPLRTGYVEAVATATSLQGSGLGSRLMTDVSTYIRSEFELGALGTGRHHFYARLGWLTWAGPTSVRAPDGIRRTRDEDGDILVLPTPTSPPLDLTASLSCDWRAGDVW